MVFYFPRALLREKNHTWNLVSTVVTPGVTVNSGPTLVRTDGGGLWSCRMSDISLSGIKGVALQDRRRQRHATLLWRSLRQVCNGGLTSIIVPRNDALFRPYPEGALVPAPLPHSDGTYFDDDTGYYEPLLDVTCRAAALRSTTLTFDIQYCGPLIGGEAFSINHPTMGWRMYEIATVEYPEDETYAEVTFNPPLREAVIDDTVIEMDRPRCVMRLANPQAMDLVVNPWTFNYASVDFVETFANAV